MKLFAFCLLAAVFFINMPEVHAQASKATIIILLRHAEKDTADQDPHLSAVGKTRAQRLPKVFKDYKPDLLYATPFNRTRETLLPWATALGLEIKSYDGGELKSFAEELKAAKGKTIVVAGHSNTTPQLLNILIGSNKYETLPDNNYSTAWVVTIQGEQATESFVKY